MPPTQPASVLQAPRAVPKPIQEPVLIAGSYTPICLLALKGNTGKFLCILVWAVALVGILIKALWINCPKWFSSVIYIGMGWLCVLAFSQIFHALSEIPKYDNLQQVMDFLNTVLSSASEYTLSFQGLQQPEDGGILRRAMQMTFITLSYDGARSMIEQLQNCPYRCQLSDFSISPVSAGGQSKDAASLLDGPVQVSVTVTFYENLS